MKKLLILLLMIFGIKSGYKNNNTVFEKDYIIPNPKKLIKKYSKMFNLPEDLCLGIADLESEFNRDMTNPKSSSSGIFGLINSTNEFIQLREGYIRVIPTLNLTTEEQIYIGIKYIKYLYDKYDGNEKLILHEYCSEEGYWKALEKRRKKYKER